MRHLLRLEVAEFSETSVLITPCLRSVQSIQEAVKKTIHAGTVWRQYACRLSKQIGVEHTSMQ